MNKQGCFYGKSFSFLRSFLPIPEPVPPPSEWVIWNPWRQSQFSASRLTTSCTASTSSAPEGTEREREIEFNRPLLLRHSRPVHTISESRGQSNNDFVQKAPRGVHFRNRIEFSQELMHRLGGRGGSLQILQPLCLYDPQVVVEMDMYYLRCSVPLPSCFRRRTDRTRSCPA